MIPKSSRPRSKQQKGRLGGPVAHQGSDEDDDEDDMLPQADGDGEGGYSYGNGGESSVPLVTKHVVEDEGDVVFDGDEELTNHGLEATNGDPGELELVPYAHRDLKPGYAMKRRFFSLLPFIRPHPRIQSFASSGPGMS